MSVTYHFESIASLADYFANRATELRERANFAGPSGRVLLDKSRRRDLLTEASAFEACAHTVRNTIIKEPKS